jgi:AraC-like DNA-binding protein
MDKLSVICTKFYQGYELKMRVLPFMPTNANQGIGERYRCVLITEGSGSVQINGLPVPLTAPSVLCLNELEEVCVHTGPDFSGRCLYFDTTVINQSLTFKAVWNPDGGAVSNGSLDFWCLKPFIDRSRYYHGLIPIDSTVSARVSGTFDAIDSLQREEPDEGWPCRSRSYLIELLFLLARIFDCPRTDEISGLNVTEEFLRPVILYLTRNFNRKVKLEELTKAFHINKTTLNQKFKKTMGISVMAYLNTLRMQIACSILQNTTMPVSLIMQRVGFMDDAHFLRSFKKYTGLTPSEYRNMNCWMIKRTQCEGSGS